MQFGIKHLLKFSSAIPACIVLIFSQSASFAETKGHKPEVFQNEILPLLDKYCYRCHDNKKQKGDFRIDVYKKASQILQDRKHWLVVLEQLETREMPTKKPLPTEEEYNKLTEYVKKAVNDIDWESVKHPGHVTMPLLTKEEYYNTLNDLIGLDLRAHSKFSEDSEGLSGFTNDRDGLFVTTSKLEKYLHTAEAAIDAVIAVNKAPSEWKLESEKMFMTEARERPQERDDGFFGYILNRGQMSLYDSIDIPTDGLYEVSVRLKGENQLTATTLRIDNQEAATIENNGTAANVHKVLLHISKGTRQFTWNIATPKAKMALENEGRVPSKEELKKAGPNARKNRLIIPQEITDAAKKANYNLKSLNSSINTLQKNIEDLRIYGVNGKRKNIVKIYFDSVKHDKSIKGMLQKMSKQLKIPAEKIFNDLNRERIADNDKMLDIYSKFEIKAGGPIGIDWMAVRGPLKNTEAKILNLELETANPDKTAEKILSDFIPKAFRRKVDKETVEKYFNLFKASYSKDKDYLESIKLALSAVLVSPRFLFRNEIKQTDKIYKLDDYQLASRLSYFLWMSMPDEELFRLAEQGKLTEPDTLKAQIKRMMNDKKSENFIRSFAGEWLGVKSLGYSVMPDKDKFPQYSMDLNEASKQETQLVLGNLFKTGGSLLDLVDAKYTYLNEDLAKHYGIQDVKGPEMRRVELKDRNRGGLLGMSSILTATSTPSRTSPVNRGLWVFETLLGQHMGIPPADVPPLPENAGSQKDKTLRQVFVEHRENPACATCHDKIDPLGFGMENFDAIGRYRTTQNGKPIDAMGKMPDGSEFNGVTELKDYIMNRKKNEFIRNMSERLLSFALGRQLQYFDEAAIRKVVDSTVKSKFNATTMLEEVILSYPFLYQSNNLNVLGDAK